MEIIGYYRDNLGATKDDIINFMVVYENSRIINGEVVKTWIEGYNVKEGHFELKDGYEYLKLGCKEISLDEYIEFTKGWHTPSEYLGEMNNI